MGERIKAAFAAAAIVGGIAIFAWLSKEQPKKEAEQAAKQDDFRPTLLDLDPRNLSGTPIFVAPRLAAIGKPHVIGLKGEDTKRDVLAILVFIMNTSETKRAAYDGWSAGILRGPSDARLRDEFDNYYDPINFGITAVIKHQIKKANIDPKGTLVDVLVFEKPALPARLLTLYLPAKVCGGVGELAFEIEVSKINKWPYTPMDFSEGINAVADN